MPSLAELRTECANTALDERQVAGDAMTLGSMSAEDRTTTHPLASRAWLVRRSAEYEAQYHGNEAIARRACWGELRARRDAFEFWQGRPARAHDRIACRRDGDRRRIERLAP